MTDTLLEKVKAAKALIEDPEHWCQGASARTKDGDGTWVKDPWACSWCSLGAWDKIRYAKSDYSENDLADSGRFFALWHSIAEAGLVSYNDFHSHDEVIEVWDKIIAKLESEI